MGMIEDAIREYASYEDRLADPLTPVAGVGLVYFKDGALHSIDDAGTVVEYGPSTGASDLVSDRVEHGPSELSNLTIASASWADMDSTNLSITMTTGAHRVLLTIVAQVFATNTGNTLTGCFSIDGTAKYDGNGVWGVGALGLSRVPMSYSWLSDVLTAGSHTFRPRWSRLGGTGTVAALCDNANDRITFSAVELLAA